MTLLTRRATIGTGLAVGLSGNAAAGAIAPLVLWTALSAAILLLMKTIRAQQPDRQGGRPVVIKDSPFAKLAELTAPAAPARRKRPRRKPKAAVAASNG